MTTDTPDPIRQPEDLQRAADGVPHRIVGLTALLSVVFALVIMVVFISGGTAATVAAVILAFVGVPVLVMNLKRRADRDRDRVHPSR